MACVLDGLRPRWGNNAKIVLIPAALLQRTYYVEEPFTDQDNALVDGADVLLQRCAVLEG